MAVFGEAGTSSAGDEFAGRDLDDLLTAVGASQEGAFAAVYLRLLRPVQGLLRRILADPGAREEVTQEVMLEIWLKAADFDSARSSATTWALMIAHSRAVDRRRSDGASARRSSAWTTGTAALWDPVAEEIEDDHERRQLRTVLGGLTDLQHEAVLLAFYGEHTYRQVAVILGVPEGTIKTRIRDALIRLRAAMSDTDGDRATDRPT
jgi:RNA polymerase sigma-70 factor, ECF subfamily